MSADEATEVIQRALIDRFRYRSEAKNAIHEWAPVVASALPESWGVDIEPSWRNGWWEVYINHRPPREPERPKAQPSGPPDTSVRQEHLEALRAAFPRC